MSLLLNSQSLTKAYGHRCLFKDLSISIFSGDRLGLIGPNGSGKSTLIKILKGIENPTSGTVSYRNGISIGYVSQTNDFDDNSPFRILYESLTDSTLPDYEKERLSETWLSKIGLEDNETSAALLSGGWKKRLAIAAELINNPTLLFLDEPTNHLDLEGILWLEKLIDREVTTFVIISHDRCTLQNLTNRIFEINPLYPEGLLAIKGSYENFLEKKELFIEGQLQKERSIASQVRRETDWLRQSPKARTTKSRSRVEKAHQILQQYDDIQRRNDQKKAKIHFDSSERKTQKLLVAKNICLAFGNKLLFQNLDLKLTPGTRLGLIGPNGSGKTSLLRLLNGELTQNQGTIKKVENLKIVYFDQHKNKLPENLTLREALAPNGEYVYFRGQPIHVNGWCKRFLFSPDILEMPIKHFSGGERARIAIAHLMLQPADILLLDEPTNDLDITTLQTLEENLIDFPGAILLITHDRYMLNQICTSFLAFDNPKEIKSYVEFSQWTKDRTPKKENKKSIPKKAKPTTDQKKELKKVEKQILSEEKKLSLLNTKLQENSIADNPEKLAKLCKDIADIEERVEILYEKLELLD